MRPEIVGWLILYLCAGYFVFSLFRFLALEPGSRSLRKLVYQPDAFGLNEHDPLWQRALVFVITLFLWPVFVLVRGAYNAFQSHSEKPLAAPESRFIARDDMLVRLVSVEEAEEEGRIQDPLGGLPNQTFGFFHTAWRKFLAEMQTGDELWAFTTQPAPEFFRKRVSGFVLLRNREIVGEFIAESN